MGPPPCRPGLVGRQPRRFDDAVGDEVFRDLVIARVVVADQPAHA